MILAFSAVFIEEEFSGKSIWTLNMSLSLDGKKSLSIVLNNKNPRSGKEVDIKMALLGTSKDHVKNSLYLL